MSVKTIVKNALILFVITLISGLLLGVAYQITKGPIAERQAEIAKLEKQMREASKMLEFEYAAVLRDRIIELRGEGKEKK